MLTCFELLHFHLGSQISAIRAVKNALREAGRFYVECVKLGAPLKYFDAGGGLGVDYDGSQTNFASSMNYTLQEYANDIVFSLQEICDRGGRPAPDHRHRIGPRRGRAPLDAGRRRPGRRRVRRRQGARTGRQRTPHRVVKQPVRDLQGGLAQERARVVPRRAGVQGRGAVSCSTLGNLSLTGPGHRRGHLLGDLPEDAASSCARCARCRRSSTGLERALSDTYFCNFSMFQSLPDIWAIDQLFPIMPIHRLNEEPTRRAVLADITCDSDGKIDHFIDRRDVRRCSSCTRSTATTTTWASS